MEEKKTLEEKQQRCVELSVEIARLRKILGIRQNEFNKLDTEIYHLLKDQENVSQPTTEDHQ